MPQKDEELPEIEFEGADQGSHTIMFWVDPSKSDEVFNKIWGTISEYKPYIKCDALVPFRVKVKRDSLGKVNKE